MDLLPQSALKLQCYINRAAGRFSFRSGSLYSFASPLDNFVLSMPVVVGSVERAPRTIPSNQQLKPEKT
jgi:hypothetical protein